jgi:hypothetical protein
MTAQGFKALAPSGVASLELFTGVATDSAYDVVLVGRDNDSGTRLGTFYETAYGNDTTKASQFFAQDASNVDVGTNTGAGNIDHVVLAASVADPAPNFQGYSSGGYVKAVLNKTCGAITSPAPRSKPCIIVAYVSISDLPSAGLALKYSGFTQSTSTAVTGQYTFWTDEHMYWNPAPSSGVAITSDQITLAQALADLVRSTYAPSAGGIKPGDMLVSRTAEGQPVTVN